MRKYPPIHVLITGAALCLLAFFISSAAPAFSQPPGAVLPQGVDPLIYLPFIAKNASAYDWLQFDGNPEHSGNNTQETILNAGNVNSLVQLFQVTLPSIAGGAPVYLRSVSTTNGIRSLVYVTTEAGHIIALDARTGATVWSHQNPAGACKINNGSTTCYTTSSPVADPDGQFVYSYGLDGKVHKYAAGSGSEVLTGGWPELATTKPYDEKGSSALSFATANNGATYLYVTNGGYPGDNGNYQGHVTAINLADGTQRVFNAMCSDMPVHFTATSPNCVDTQSAIWARPGVIYDPRTDKIYMSTGNGNYLPSQFHDWGDSVFAIHPDGTGLGGDPLDAYTPTNFQALQNADADLGSTAPAILPVPPASSVQHLAVQSGKDGKLRLLNLDNLSGQGGPGHTGGEIGPIINVPQGGLVLTQPAVWINPADGSTWVFVTDQVGISGLRLTLGAGNVPQLIPVWQKPAGGTSPLVANGVLYYYTGHIHGLDPTNGNELWTTSYNGFIHWESPIVANGVVYISDELSRLTAYALP